MRKRYSIFAYPVVIKKIKNYLVFRLPDLEITHVLELPVNGRLNPRYLMQISKSLAQLWIKAQERLDHIEDSVRIHTFPKPSSMKNSLKPIMEEDLSAPQVAKILGVHPDTIRRAADKGKVPCYLTTGGHRRFLERDVEKLKETLSEAF